jgi:hypothetical protein
MRTWMKLKIDVSALMELKCLTPSITIANQSKITSKLRGVTLANRDRSKLAVFAKLAEKTVLSATKQHAYSATLDTSSLMANATSAIQIAKHATDLMDALPVKMVVSFSPLLMEINVFRNVQLALRKMNKDAKDAIRIVTHAVTTNSGSSKRMESSLAISRNRVLKATLKIAIMNAELLRVVSLDYG